MRALIAFLSLLPSLAAADIAPPEVPARGRQRLIEVIAVLEEMGPTGPLCGTEDVVVPMRYNKIDVIDGELTGDVLWAAHHCPEMTRRQYGGASAGDLERFVLHEWHQLWLQPTKVRIGGVEAYPVVRVDLDRERGE